MSRTIGVFLWPCGSIDRNVMVIDDKMAALTPPPGPGCGITDGISQI